MIAGKYCFVQPLSGRIAETVCSVDNRIVKGHASQGANKHSVTDLDWPILHHNGGSPKLTATAWVGFDCGVENRPGGRVQPERAEISGVVRMIEVFGCCAVKEVFGPWLTVPITS